MSRTLSSNVSAGKAGGVQVIYLIRFYGRLISTGAVYTNQYSTKDTNSITHWTGSRFYGGYLSEGGIGKIVKSIDLSKGGGSARIGNIEFQMLNQGDIYNTIFRLYTYENQDVEIRVIFDDPADATYATGTKQPSWNNALCLFKGQIDNVELGRDVVVFTCRDYFTKIHKELPQVKFDIEDFPNLPAGLINKVLPLQYGDMGGTGDFHKKLIKGGPIGAGTPENFGHPGDFAKAYYVGEGYLDDEDQNWNILIASHNLVLLRPLTTSGYTATVCKYHNALNGFYKVNSNVGGFLWGGAYCLSFISQYRALNPIEIIPLLENSNALLDGSEVNAVDEDKDNWTSITYEKWVTYKFGQAEDPGGLAGRQYFIRASFAFDGTLGSDFLLVHILIDGQLVDAVAIVPSGQIEYNIITINDDTVWWNESLTCLELKFIYTAVGGGSHPAQIKIKNIYLYTVEDETIGENDEFYVALQGRPAGSWAGDLNGIAEDDLIENPAHTIASLLIDELEQTTAELNITQFDAVATTDRGGYSVAMSVLDKIKSNELIAKICKEAGMIYLLDNDGKHSVIAIKTGTSGGTLTTANFLENSISVDRPPVSEIYSDFTVYYKKNYASGEYEEQAFIHNADEATFSTGFTTIEDPDIAETYWDKCKDVYDKYNSNVNKFEIYCDTIRDDASAELLLKWLVDMFTFRPFIVSHYTKGLSEIDLEIGDLRKINHPLLPTGVSNSSIFMLTGVTTEPKTNKIRFDWRELPSTLN